jgi:hypothetical protein
MYYNKNPALQYICLSLLNCIGMYRFTSVKLTVMQIFRFRSRAGTHIRSDMQFMHAQMHTQRTPKIYRSQFPGLSNVFFFLTENNILFNHNRYLVN